MKYSIEQKRAILKKTGSRCHICWSRVYLKNHGVRGARGGWEIDHSRPRAIGGADHMNNFLAACWGCNVDKGAGTTRTARRRAGHGRTRAPLSRTKQAETRVENALGFGLIGAVVGGLFGGPPGAAIGTGIGAILGGSAEVE